MKRSLIIKDLYNLDNFNKKLLISGISNNKFVLVSKINLLTYEIMTNRTLTNDITDSFWKLHPLFVKNYSMIKKEKINHRPSQHYRKLLHTGLSYLD